ncbi:hypothetical protein ACLOJK_019373 [Asimina triloba]
MQKGTVSGDRERSKRERKRKEETWKSNNHLIPEDDNLSYTTRYDPCACGTNRVDLDEIKKIKCATQRPRLSLFKAG